MQAADPVRSDAAAATPLVTVILPAFNSEATIAQALDSIAAQDYPRLQVLVIDDGSADGTVAAVRRIMPDATVLQQANRGAGAARNLGLQEAKGELIAFLDADDCWFPGKLRAQVSALARRPEAGFCYTSWHVGPAAPDGSALESLARAESWPDAEACDPALSGWIYHELLLDVVIHTSTLLLRRELASAVGRFDESLKRGQDFDYWLRMSRLAQGIKLARPFALYRQHGGNSTTRPQPRNYGYEILARALARWGSRGPDGRGPDAAQIRARRSRLCRDFAYLHARAGDPRTALREAARAIGCDPLDPRNLWLSLKTGGRAAMRWLGHS
jgi:glycosyltransferase involved in cell wall biosynthesis